MKIFTKNILPFACVAAFPALFLSSCSKQPIDLGQQNPVAAVSVIQASPGQPGANLYIEGGKANSTPFNYGDNTGYFSVDAGADSIVFKNAATSATFFKGAYNFPKNMYHSVFLANTPDKAELVVLTDTLSQPSTGKTAVRFVDLSPDAPAVDLVIKDGPTLVTNKGFKGYSGFLPLTGNQTYTIEVHQSGTSTVLAKVVGVQLTSNYLYTIWFHGLAGGTPGTDGLAVSVYLTAYFL